MWIQVSDFAAQVKTLLNNLFMGVLRTKLVVGGDDGGGGRGDQGLGGGDAGQGVQVVEAQEEDERVEGKNK